MEELMENLYGWKKDKCGVVGCVSVTEHRRAVKDVLTSWSCMVGGNVAWWGGGGVAWWVGMLHGG